METIKIDKNELLKLYNCPENIKPYIYGNRLIGLFMGKTLLNKLTILYSLKYHESWDWLMPCVGRISEICEEPDELERLKYALLTNNIDEAWIAVVDFIGSHNNKPKE